MTTLKPLLAKNRSVALQRFERNPDYFAQYLHQQKPRSLRLGQLKQLAQPFAEGPVP